MGFQNNAKRVFTIPLQGTPSFNPVSATTYYISNVNTTNTWEGIRCEQIEYNGIIRAASTIWFCNGTPGSAEVINAYIHFSPIKEYLFASVGTTSGQRIFRNNNLNIPVVVNDSFNIKFVCPTWTTLPTYICISGLVWIEMT